MQRWPAAIDHHLPHEGDGAATPAGAGEARAQGARSLGRAHQRVQLLAAALVQVPASVVGGIRLLQVGTVLLSKAVCTLSIILASTLYFTLGSMTEA